ncbi:WD40 repeat-like protein [Meredithblackwellia eburnea MCA 4105]
MVDDFDDSDDVEPPSFLKIHIGPISTTSVDQKELKLDRFASTRLDEFYPQKPGYLLNAGGPVTSVSWLPQSDAPNLEKEFLIISTQSEPHLLQHSPATCSASFQLWSIDCSVPSDLSTETDDNKKGVGAKLEYLLALDVGEALDLKWCPRGGGLEEGSGKAGLGIVAGVMTDGSISLFRVPGAEEVRKVSGAKSTPAVNIHPLLALKLPNTSCLSFAWASHETIVAGCINGHVAVWSVKTALDTGVESVWPTHYFPVHMAPIRSVDIIRLPPIGPDGEPDLDGEPESIITCSYDGSTRFIHLNDPSAVGTLSFERTSLYSISFFPFTTSALSADADGNVRAIALKPEQSGITRQITHQRGPIWSIASSDHHAFVATASADGTCVITNGVRGQHKQSHIRKFIHKVLKVDFNRRTGEYRLLDNIMPESRPINDESGATRRRAKASAAQPLQLLASTMDDSLSGAWSPEVGVLRTAWCPQKTRSCLLATGLACGLVKIDWVERVWD